jgi:hypothetical protein
MRLPCAFGLALAALALPGLAPAQPTVDLFNGRDLTGWVQRGGKAKFSVEGNTIVGTAVKRTPNSFLCTEKSYGDFVLQYDFKVDPRLNSGVQIRSECVETNREFIWGGETNTIPAGRVHGYQVEIDPGYPKGLMWSAGIWDEARRRCWLYPEPGNQAQGEAFTEQGRRLFKTNDWNHVRVEAVGDSIKTWLNGVPCAKIKDSMTARGFIGLQVHGVGGDVDREGAQVRWRNLKLTEIKASAPPASFRQ